MRNVPVTSGVCDLAYGAGATHLRVRRSFISSLRFGCGNVAPDFHLLTAAIFSWRTAHGCHILKFSMIDLNLGGVPCACTQLGVCGVVSSLACVFYFYFLCASRFSSTISTFGTILYHLLFGSVGTRSMLHRFRGICGTKCRQISLC